MAGNVGIWRIVQRRRAIVPSARQLRWLAYLAPALAGGVVGVLEYGIAHDPVVFAAADVWQVTAVTSIMIGKARHISLTRKERLLLLGSILLAAIVGRASIPLTSAKQFDWLYVSGVLAWTIGVELSEHTDAIFERTLRSLFESGVARGTNGELRAIRGELRRRKSLYRKKAGFWIALAMMLAWLIFVIVALVPYGGVAHLRHQLPQLFTANSGIVVIEVLAAVIAGQYVGEMVAYAAAWRSLQPKLNLIPGHPDGTAGLKMIGRFYFRQALISGIPAAYLAIWWYIAPAFPWYVPWRNIYLGLLAVAMIIEVIAFFLPMRAIHLAMVAERYRRSLEADRLMVRIGKLQEALVNADPESRDNMSKELAILVDWVRTLRMLPAWPVDPALRRWFTLSNIALFVPFLSYVIGNTRLWNQAATILNGLKH